MTNLRNFPVPEIRAYNPPPLNRLKFRGGVNIVNFFYSINLLKKFFACGGLEEISVYRSIFYLQLPYRNFCFPGIYRQKFLQAEFSHSEISAQECGI